MVKRGWMLTKMLDKLKNEGLIRVVEKEEEDKKYKCLEKVR
jgi:DNA-binding PadR family transcriptional regulator